MCNVQYASYNEIYTENDSVDLIFKIYTEFVPKQKSRKHLNETTLALNGWIFTYPTDSGVKYWKCT